jgi:hypothetical protein
MMGWELDDQAGQLRTVFPDGGCGGSLGPQLSQKYPSESPYLLDSIPVDQLLASKKLFQLLFEPAISMEYPPPEESDVLEST